MLAAPAKAEAFLPQGCLTSDADEGRDAIVDMEHPELLDKNVFDRSFANWVSKVNSQLADIAPSRGVGKHRYWPSSSFFQ